MQKILLLVGAVIGALAGVLLVPVIARLYPSGDLAVLSLLLMMHSFFGVMDVLKPIYIRDISRDSSLCNYYNLILPSFFSGLFFAAIVFLILNFGLSEYFSYVDKVFVSLAVLIFVIYSSMWAVLDAHERVGTGALIRGSSTAALYITYACKAIFAFSFSLTSAFFAVQIMALFLFWRASRVHVSGPVSFSNGLSRGALWLMCQNSGKTLADFFDRFFVSSSFASALVGVYNISYDMAAKINLPAQLFSAYWYPLLCRDRTVASHFLLLGGIYSICVSIFSIIVYVFGNKFYFLYFGEQFEGYLWLFCVLMNIASLYSVSFFCQAVMRAARQDVELVLSFLLPAILGAAYILFYGSQGLAFLLIGVVIMKSSSIFLAFYLRSGVAASVLVVIVLSESLSLLSTAYILAENWS